MESDREEKLWNIVFFVLGEKYPFLDGSNRIFWQNRQAEVMKLACEIDRDKVMAYFGERLKAISEHIRGRSFEEARELQRIAFQLTLSNKPDF